MDVLNEVKDDIPLVAKNLEGLRSEFFDKFQNWRKYEAKNGRKIPSTPDSISSLLCENLSTILLACNGARTKKSSLMRPENQRLATEMECRHDWDALISNVKDMWETKHVGYQ